MLLHAGEVVGGQSVRVYHAQDHETSIGVLAAGGGVVVLLLCSPDRGQHVEECQPHSNGEA